MRRPRWRFSRRGGGEGFLWHSGLNRTPAGTHSGTRASALQSNVPCGFFRLVLGPFYLNTFQSWLVENSASLGNTWAADLQMTMWLLK